MQASANYTVLCMLGLQRLARSLPVPVLRTHVHVGCEINAQDGLGLFDAIARVLAPISASRYQSPRGPGRVGDVGGQR